MRSRGGQQEEGRSGVGRRRVNIFLSFFFRLKKMKRAKASLSLFFLVSPSLVFSSSFFTNGAPRRAGPDAAPGLAQDPRHGQRPGLLLEPGDQHDDLREADGGRRRRGALSMMMRRERAGGGGGEKKNSKAQAAADDVFFVRLFRGAAPLLLTLLLPLIAERVLRERCSR